MGLSLVAVIINSLYLQFIVRVRVSFTLRLAVYFQSGRLGVKPLEALK
jgi:hypothetical protein